MLAGLGMRIGIRGVLVISLVSLPSISSQNDKLGESGWLILRVAHSYQYTFAPNPEWSRVYARGPEIHQYLKSVVKRYSVDRFVKLSHQVLDVEWHEDVSKWYVADAPSQVYVLVCNILMRNIGSSPSRIGSLAKHSSTKQTSLSVLVAR